MSGQRIARLAPLLGLLVCAGACSAEAQGSKSQLGAVSQTVAGTRIDVVYRRPVARGRELFGALVPWGRIWTPSADSAARITLSGPVTVNGEPLAASAPLARLK